MTKLADVLGVNRADGQERKATGFRISDEFMDDPVLREIVAMMAEGLPVNRDRPVRMLTIRPDGYFEHVNTTDDERPLTERQFKEGLGRLIQVANEGGWPVTTFKYKWDDDRRAHWIPP